MSPCHISPRPDARKHLCGAKHDELPYVGAHAVGAHVAGYGLEVCAPCWAEFEAPMTLFEMEATDGVRR